MFELVENSLDILVSIVTTLHAPRNPDPANVSNVALNEDQDHILNH